MISLVYRDFIHPEIPALINHGIFLQSYIDTCEAHISQLVMKKTSVNIFRRNKFHIMIYLSI